MHLYSAISEISQSRHIPAHRLWSILIGSLGFAKDFDTDRAFTELARDLPISSPRQLILVIPKQFQHLSPSLLINASYEESFRVTELAKGAKRAKDGIFYTPDSIVNKIIDLTLKRFIQDADENSLRSLSILDPACGGGIFLAQSYIYLESAVNRNNISASINLSALYGLDKDPAAILITRLTLLMLAIVSDGSTERVSKHIATLKDNIRLHDTLCGTTGHSVDPGSELLPFPKVTNQGGFSVIMGNPPYGLSRDQKINLTELMTIKKTFSRFLHGKPNKYFLFLGLGSIGIKSNGYCGMIVPNSWLGITSAQRLREHLVQNQLIERLLIYEKNVFKDPSLEPIVVIMKSVLYNSQFYLERYNDPTDPRPKTVTKIPFDACRRTPAFLIPTNWSEKSASVMEVIMRNSFPLGSEQSPFISRVALQAYATGKGVPPQTFEDVKNRIYDTNSKVDSNTFPYLDGRDIERFRITWRDKFLRHGPFLADPQPIQRYLQPRVLVREIINPPPFSLVATYTSAPFLYNKSVLHIHEKTTSPSNESRLLKSLSGILNSEIASYIIQLNGRKSQRKVFPKVVNDDLRQFPLPLRLLEFSGQICEIIDRLMQKRLEASTALFEIVSVAYNLDHESKNLLQEYSVNPKSI